MALEFNNLEVNQLRLKIFYLVNKLLETMDGGRNFTSREVARRLNLQKDELIKLAKNVHHGSKNDFIALLAESVTSKKDHGNNNWDGTLSPQDVGKYLFPIQELGCTRFVDQQNGN